MGTGFLIGWTGVHQLTTLSGQLSLNPRISMPPSSNTGITPMLHTDSHMCSGDQNSDAHVSVASSLPNHPLPSPPMNFVTFLSLVHHVRYRRAEGYKMCLLICSSWHYSEPHLNIIEEYSTPLYGPSLSSLKNWYVYVREMSIRLDGRPKITK